MNILKLLCCGRREDEESLPLVREDDIEKAPVTQEAAGVQRAIAGGDTASGPVAKTPPSTFLAPLLESPNTDISTTSSVPTTPTKVGLDRSAVASSNSQADFSAANSTATTPSRHRLLHNNSVGASSNYTNNSGDFSAANSAATTPSRNRFLHNNSVAGSTINGDFSAANSAKTTPSRRSDVGSVSASPKLASGQRDKLFPPSVTVTETQMNSAVSGSTEVRLDNGLGF